MGMRAAAREIVPGSTWPRRTFAVGRLTRTSAEIQLSEAKKAPRAPFLLKAVVSGPRPAPGETVH